MNKTVLQIAFIIASLSLCGLLFSGPKFTPVSEAKYDWGEVSQGDKVNHSFKFENTGDDTLIILNVRSSCGCTAALASNDHIAPGQIGEISTSFNSAGRSKKQRKTINVSTNDPENPNFTFVLEGHVKVPVEITPSYLAFQSVAKGATSTSEVTITNNLDNAIELGAPKSPNSELQINMDKQSLKPGESIKVTGIFKPVKTQGRLTGTVVIPYAGEQSKSIKIRVWGRIKES
jgi:hypothetical protein